MKPTQEIYLIDDVETLRVVVDPRRLRVLEVLTEEPLNVKQIAERLGEKPTRLYYHINALRDSGLVQVAETRMKKNMVEKYYIAIARDFRVDSRLLKTKTKKTETVRASVPNTVLQATSNDVELAVDQGLIVGADSDLAASPNTVFSRSAHRFRSSQIPHLIDRLHLLLAEFSQAEVAHGEEIYGLTIAFYPRSTDPGK